MRVRLVSILAGVACVALLGVPAAAPAAGPTLSLDSNHRIIFYKQHAQVSGRLSSGEAGRTVLIKGDQFPYGKPRIVARTTTRGNGRFAAQVRPKLNTNYRAVLKGTSPAVSSKPARVAVVPNVHSTCNYCRDAPNRAGHYTLKLKSTLFYPTAKSARSERNKPSFFYYGSRKGHKPPRRLKLRERVGAKYLGGRKLRVVFRYRFRRPASAYVFQLTTCSKDSPRTNGLGLPGNHHCGDKSISSNFGYLGRPGSMTAAKRLP